MTPAFTWAVDAILVLALVTTIVTDLKWRRIPDWITGPALVLGLVIGFLAGGWGPDGFGALQLKLVGALACLIFADFVASYLPDRVIDFADFVVAPVAIVIFLWVAYTSFQRGEGFSDELLQPSATSAMAGALALWFGFRLSTYPGWIHFGDVKLLAALGALFQFRAVIGVLFFIACAGFVQAVFAFLARTKPGRAVCARLGMEGTEAEDFARMLPFGLSIAVGGLVFRVWQRFLV